MALFYIPPLDLMDVLGWIERLRSTLDDGYVVWTEADEDFVRALIDTIYST